VYSDMSIAQNEMFGPAVCVMPFETSEEAVQIANQSAFGLSGAIHTRDVEHGAELAKQIDSGAIHVNDGTINDEPLAKLVSVAKRFFLTKDRIFREATQSIIAVGGVEVCESGRWNAA